MSLKKLGFAKTRSTTGVIYHFASSVVTALDSSKKTVGFFSDLSKAFDNVNHTITIKKLHSYRIRGLTLHWLSLYLTHRIQYVEVKAVDGSGCL